MAKAIDDPLPTLLPLLAIPHPNLLLPALQLTLPISAELVRPLVSIVRASEHPIIAVIPLKPAQDQGGPEYHEWGCAARIIRVSRPSGILSSQHHTLTVQGLTRIRLAQPLPGSPPSDHLPSHSVIYPTPSEVDAPVPEQAVVAFRGAALRVLERLEQESGTIGGKQYTQDVWHRLRDLVHETSANGGRSGGGNVVWVADVILGVVGGDWDDKLAFLSMHDPTQRLTKATEIFTKRAAIAEVTTKISQDVGESLSKQQKEFFLRQQMQAIQRELSRLTNSKGGNNNRLGGTVARKDAKGGSGSGSELDDEADDADDLADLKVKIEAMEPGSEERKMGVREWKRLKKIPQGSVENGVIRNYLEWLTSLPWPKSQPASVAADPSSPASTALSPVHSRSFLTNARAQLDADHFGLEKIKRRLIEYLAVVRLKEMNAAKERETLAAQTKEIHPTDDHDVTPASPILKTPKRRTGVNKGPILLLVGPPGCGKTSIAQSVAKALQRPFQRISLGGVRDEAEIRGHRRTYVASGPGNIVQALRKGGRDMVLLLDEIDKVGHNNFHGDPSAALLEVLDPEQNHTFTDHYINVPIDLSQILFIATANSLDTISGPLLDRCEVIQLSGYTYDEKLHISRRYLLPKQLEANGLPADQLEVTEGALLHIATHYTREAGVRNLERQIGSVARYKAVEWADAAEAAPSLIGVAGGNYDPVVDVRDLETILGMERYDSEEREREERRGVVYGMVVMGEGEGGILSVETAVVPGSGGLKLTGSLGEVIKESGQLALSWVKSHAYAMGITSSPNQDPLRVPELIDIHLHLPAGAQKKDGPSAGIAMVCAFVSLLTGATVPSYVAMTGEITLRGNVTPIGGAKEKILGAHRAGITKVIVPRKNQKDVEHDLGSTHPVRRDVEIVFVSTVREALDAAFGPGVITWRQSGSRAGFLVESRL